MSQGKAPSCYDRTNVIRLLSQADFSRCKHRDVQTFSPPDPGSAGSYITSQAPFCSQKKAYEKILSG